MPKNLNTTGASVAKTWTIIGYEVVMPKGQAPTSGSIGIRVAVDTMIGEETFTTVESHTCSGPEAVQVLLNDAGARVAQLLDAGAQAPAAYYAGTRDALYAWLQSSGTIPNGAA